MTHELVDPTLDLERLLTRGEVAKVLRVCARTVTSWAYTGKLQSIRTPGGQYRYRQTDVLELLSPSSDHASENKNGLARCVTTETSP